MKAVVVEDNLKFRKTLVEIVESWGIDFVCCAESGEELLSFLEDHCPDLAFLDISLPKVSGLEVARYIRKHYPMCEIIFITSHDHYVKDAVQLYAADYITKPLDLERLRSTIERLKHKATRVDNTLEITAGQEVHFLREGDINFVQALRNNVIIYLHDGQMEANHSLKEVQAMVGEGFFRTSRSYLVNLAKVTGIKPYSKTSYELTFTGMGSAILSKKLYEEFRRQVKNIAVRKGRSSGF